MLTRCFSSQRKGVLFHGFNELRCFNTKCRHSLKKRLCLHYVLVRLGAMLTCCFSSQRKGGCFMDSTSYGISTLNADIAMEKRLQPSKSPGRRYGCRRESGPLGHCYQHTGGDVAAPRDGPARRCRREGVAKTKKGPDVFTSKPLFVWWAVKDSNLRPMD